MEEEPPTPPTPAPPSSPFWLQSSTTSHALHRPSSSFLLNSAFQVTLLCISALVLLAVAAPSLISLSHQLFRPNSVKRGWDSLNLLLVLFAVVCGFLGRSDGEDRNGGAQSPLVRTPQSGRSGDRHGWFGNQGSGLRLRSFKSYPDLRQEMLWDVDSDRRLIRSYDDSFVGTCKSPKLNFTTVQSFGYRHIDADREENDESEIKNIEVDTVRTPEKEESPPPPPSPPPPQQEPTPPQPATGPPRARRDGRKRRELEPRVAKSSSPVRRTRPPPPPPPSPPPPQQKPTPPQSATEPPRARRDGRKRRELEPRVAKSSSPVRRTRPPPPPQEVAEDGEGGMEGSGSRKIRKKRGGVAKEIISSFYQPSKRKKKRKSKSQENLEEFVQTPNPSLRSPPPPPPPPPHHSMFQGIFSTKKGRSSKKAPPPPPPPPPRRTSASQSIYTRPRNFNSSTGNGSESPSIPIPPPPPPPPFKMTSWKFAIEGDYAKIMGSPHAESEESTTSTPVAPGSTLSPFFCPSPDVNTKADNFIARFKAKLQLEKINSMKQKQEMGVGFSQLGPDSNPKFQPPNYSC